MILDFYTDKSVKVPAISTDQMREVDRIAMEETGPNLYQMMENAGRNIAVLAMKILGEDWKEKSIVVLAGSGGNGGGGICAARHLANRGADVKLHLSNPGNLKEVVTLQYKIFKTTHGTEISLEALKMHIPDLIIDALIGYSLWSAPKGNVLDAIQWANGTGSGILSLDIPSGVDSTTGETPGEYIKATNTLTLALPKTGLDTTATGNLFLGDIGIPVEVYRKLGFKFDNPFDERFIVPLFE